MDELDANLARRRAEVTAEAERQTAGARRTAERAISELTEREQTLNQQVAELDQLVVTTEEAAILQEVGVYEYRHPLTNAVGYQAQLKRLKDTIKALAMKDGGAVLANTNWTVNGSAPKGRAMVRDYSKLVLGHTTRRPTISCVH